MCSAVKLLLIIIGLFRVMASEQNHTDLLALSEYNGLIREAIISVQGEMRNGLLVNAAMHSHQTDSFLSFLVSVVK